MDSHTKNSSNVENVSYHDIKNANHMTDSISVVIQ